MKKFIWISYILLGLSSCAIQKPPTGGPVDKSPPVIVTEIPDNFLTMFKGKRIEIEFNEYITLRNPANEILLSPPLTENPKYTLKGKTLGIEFNSELEDSTTYTIQFGDAIADLTEGNILKDYTYVFSTGDVLDSLSIKGKVLNAYTGDVSENLKVLLYEKDCDSCIFYGKPRYFSRTDKEGSFEFYNLKAGVYWIYALGDENRNYYYNPGELVGFYSEAIEITKDTTLSDFYVFINEEQSTKLIAKAGIKPNRIELKFNKGVDIDSITLIKEEL